MEIDANTKSAPDMFGSRHIWSEESSEMMRWSPPLVIAGLCVLAAVGLLVYVLANPVEDNPVQIVLAVIALLGGAGCVAAGWLGGPKRVEIDRSAKTLTATHARRFRPTSQTWQFDEIVDFHLLDHETDSENDDGNRKRFDEYFVVLHPVTGADFNLFGRYFLDYDSEKRCRDRLGILAKQTGRPERNVGEIVMSMKARKR